MDGQSASTRDRIMEAAVETLRSEGIAGTTARGIARRGGFNQALIFYHFGTVSGLLMEAFGRTSNEQIARYREAAGDVASLQDLVGIARRLHDEDEETGAVAAVTQLMAAASDPEVAGQMRDRFDEWIEIVERALERALATNPLASTVPTRSAAYAIAAMFLGIELIDRLDPERSEAHELFDMMANVARMIEDLTPLVAALSLPFPGPGGEAPHA